MNDTYEQWIKNEKLEQAIELEKKRRPRLSVQDKSDYLYKLKNHANGKTLRLCLFFYDLEREPEFGDILYFSDSVFEGIQENLYVYQFSTIIGKECARPPHDFLIDPKEFLILKYMDDNKTILLEQQYG